MMAIPLLKGRTSVTKAKKTRRAESWSLDKKGLRGAVKTSMDLADKFVTEGTPLTWK